MRLVFFYRRFLPVSPQIEYIQRSDWKQNKPDWLIINALGEGWPPPLLVIPHIGSYSLFNEYRYSGYGSGWHWIVYQKKAKADQPAPAA